MNESMTKMFGYQCPVKGCPKRHNRRFGLIGLVMHMKYEHGIEEVEKRLRCKIMGR